MDTPQVVSGIPVAMTIAGSDSGGGAGIQADLRTFAFHKVHGTSALTCVTAQNTLGVTRVDALPPESVVAQMQAVVKDIGVHAAKTGMLLNQAIIAVVVEQVIALGITNLVVDPVMVSRTGAQLIDDAAIACLKTKLLPLAKIVTPNRYEAQILSGQEVVTLDDMLTAAKTIHQFGCHVVVIKGGGMTGDLKAVDVWFDGRQSQIVKIEAVNTPHTHGTGCTLSAAIAANLALGYDNWQAVTQAKTYVTNALYHSLAIGSGQGPVGHFYPLL